MELPLLARLKGCYAVYDIRSIGEQSGRTTSPTRIYGPTGHAIGGTAQVALRSSSTATFNAGPRQYQ